MTHEIAFEMAASNIRFGSGVTRKSAWTGRARRAPRLVVADPVSVPLAPVQTVLESLEANRIPFKLYDRVRVEPTDESFHDAIAFAQQSDYDAFVAVGGSATDTAAKRGESLHHFIRPPISSTALMRPSEKAFLVPGPLKPLIADFTTAGTGSETTGVSIFDLTRMHAKTGIASRRLKPTLGLLDPDNTRSMPPQVAASSGLDILSHAVESYTSRRHSRNARFPARPALRPAYQG